jgi:D-alanyl-D-alanine carboxypeptidase
MRNHNHLLGNVEGVDGIKTGFTRDSGFNLVTSVKRGPRFIVAVVLGGRSASSRDARMRDLIETHIAQASTKPPAALVAEAAKPEATPAPAANPQLASANSAQESISPAQESISPPRANEAVAPIAPGSNAPITPVKVKTVIVKLMPPKNGVTNTVTASVMPAPTAKPEPMHATAFAATTPDEALAETLAAAAPIETTAPSAPTSAPLPPVRPGVLGTLPAAAATKVQPTKAKPAPKVVASAKTESESKAEERYATAPRHAPRGGWAIQVGAYEDEGEAKQKISTAKGKITDVLKKAEAYIERTVKGAKTYYRARFAGFDRDQAEAACKRLKREDVACMALKI